MNAPFRNPRPDSLRRRMEAAVERLIKAMDALDAANADIEQRKPAMMSPTSQTFRAWATTGSLTTLNRGIGYLDGMLKQGCRMPGQYVK
jgi:hypothetical protein